MLALGSKTVFCSRKKIASEWAAICRLVFQVFLGGASNRPPRGCKPALPAVFLFLRFTARSGAICSRVMGSFIEPLVGGVVDRIGRRAAGVDDHLADALGTEGAGAL